MKSISTLPCSKKPAVVPFDSKDIFKSSTIQVWHSRPSTILPKLNFPWLFPLIHPRLQPNEATHLPSPVLTSIPLYLECSSTHVCLLISHVFLKLQLDLQFTVSSVCRLHLFYNPLSSSQLSPNSPVHPLLILWNFSSIYLQFYVLHLACNYLLSFSPLYMYK